MKLDLPELERGIEKEAGVLGDLAQGAKGLMGGLTGGNMMDGLGSAMMGILPIAMAFGGGKKRAPIAPQFPGAAKPLLARSTVCQRLRKKSEVLWTWVR